MYIVCFACLQASGSDCALLQHCFNPRTWPVCLQPATVPGCSAAVPMPDSMHMARIGVGGERDQGVSKHPMYALNLAQWQVQR